MAAGERKQLSISLYKPLVVVDVIDGQWYANVSDGTTKVQVTQWPLQNHRFNADSNTVIHIELFLADSELHFLRSNGKKFADVHIPAMRVKDQHGSLFRGWFGLQRGCNHDQVSTDVAQQLYEVGVSLARNLLTPKICCSLIDVDFADRATAPIQPVLPGLDQWEASLRRSVMQHGNIIAHMHHQLHTLWAQGKLVSMEEKGGGITAQLMDTGDDQLLNTIDGASRNAAGDALALEHIEKLQGEVVRLTEALTRIASELEESERTAEHHYRQKLLYRERLSQFTTDLPDDDHPGIDGLADTSSGTNIQTLQREIRQLEDALQAERLHTTQLEQRLREAGPMSSRSQSPLSGRANRSERRRLDEFSQLNEMQSLQIEGLRKTERELRGQMQELRLENDKVLQDKMQCEAEVNALKEELWEKTSRLMDAWSHQSGQAAGQGQGSQVVTDPRTLMELEKVRRDTEQLQRQLHVSEELVGKERRACQELRERADRLEEELSSEIQRHAKHSGTLVNENNTLAEEVRNVQVDRVRSQQREEEVQDELQKLRARNEEMLVLHGTVARDLDNSRDEGTEREAAFSADLHAAHDMVKEYALKLEFNEQTIRELENRANQAAAREQQRSQEAVGFVEKSSEKERFFRQEYETLHAAATTRESEASVVYDQLHSRHQALVFEHQARSDVLVMHEAACSAAQNKISEVESALAAGNERSTEQAVFTSQTLNQQAALREDIMLMERSTSLELQEALESRSLEVQEVRNMATAEKDRLHAELQEHRFHREELQRNLEDTRAGLESQVTAVSSREAVLREKHEQVQKELATVCYSAQVDSQSSSENENLLRHEMEARKQEFLRKHNELHCDLETAKQLALSKTDAHERAETLLLSERQQHSNAEENARRTSTANALKHGEFCDTITGLQEDIRTLRQSGQETANLLTLADSHAEVRHRELQAAREEKSDYSARLSKYESLEVEFREQASRMTFDAERLNREVVAAGASKDSLEEMLRDEMRNKDAALRAEISRLNELARTHESGKDSLRQDMQSQEGALRLEIARLEVLAREHQDKKEVLHGDVRSLEATMLSQGTTFRDDIARLHALSLEHESGKETLRGEMLSQEALLRQDIARCEMLSRDHETGKEAFSQQVNKLQASNEQHQRDLSETRLAHIADKDTLAKKDLLLGNFELEQRSAYEEYRALLQQEAALQKRHDQIQRELGYARQGAEEGTVEYAEKERQLIDKYDRLQCDLDSALKNSIAECEALKTADELFRSETDLMRRQIEQHEGAHSLTQSELGDHIVHIGGLASDNEELLQEANAARDEVRSLLGEQQEWHRQIADSFKQNRQLENDLQGAREAHQLQSDALSAEMQNFTRQSKSLEDAGVVHDMRSQAAATEAAGLLGEAERWKLESHSHQEKAENLRSRHETGQAELQASDEALKTLDEALRVTMDQVRGQESEEAALRVQIDELRSRALEMQSELTASAMGKDSMEEVLRDNVRSLQSRIEALQQELTHMEDHHQQEFASIESQHHASTAAEQQDFHERFTELMALKERGDSELHASVEEKQNLDASLRVAREQVREQILMVQEFRDSSGVSVQEVQRSSDQLMQVRSEHEQLRQAEGEQALMLQELRESTRASGEKIGCTGEQLIQATAEHEQLKKLESEQAEMLHSYREMTGASEEQLQRANEHVKQVRADHDQMASRMDEESTRLLSQISVHKEESAKMQAQMESSKEAQRAAQRELELSQDASRGEIDQLRRTVRSKTAEAKEHSQVCQDLQEQLYTARSVTPVEAPAVAACYAAPPPACYAAPPPACYAAPPPAPPGQGRKDLLQTELQQMNTAVQERELQLKAEINDLEEANNQMARCSKRQYDEMAQLQQCLSNEFSASKQNGGDDRAGVGANELNALNSHLQAQLDDMHTELQDMQQNGAHQLEEQAKQMRGELLDKSRELAVVQAEAESAADMMRESCDAKVKALEAQLKSLGVAPSTSGGSGAARLVVGGSFAGGGGYFTPLVRMPPSTG